MRVIDFDRSFGSIASGLEIVAVTVRRVMSFLLIAAMCSPMKDARLSVVFGKSLRFVLVEKATVKMGNVGFMADPFRENGPSGLFYPGCR